MGMTAWEATISAELRAKKLTLRESERSIIRAHLRMQRCSYRQFNFPFAIVTRMSVQSEEVCRVRHFSQLPSCHCINMRPSPDKPLDTCVSENWRMVRTRTDDLVVVRYATPRVLQGRPFITTAQNIFANPHTSHKQTSQPISVMGVINKVEFGSTRLPPPNSLDSLAVAACKAAPLVQAS